MGVIPVDWTACDWGGFVTVLHMLDFWRGWLVSSLVHAARGAEASILLRFMRIADPLASAVAISLVLAAICFLLSLPTNRHSWVDKLWSIAPVYYAWHFALHDQLGDRQRDLAGAPPLNARLLAMAALVTVWGVRLTWNFARKGGYRYADEDYRWPWLRARIHPLPFLVFNATFIATIQHLLLLALVAPAYLAWQNVGRPLSALDAAATALVAGFILAESVADQQQWVFQTTKHALIRAGQRLPAPYARGFITSGLFRFSRHPNFFSEQMIWWSFYLFGVSASGRWLNWTLVGPAFLTALFQGSTWLTELISSAKYPSYAEYQRTTSRLVPWFPGEPAAEEEEGEGTEEEEEGGESEEEKKAEGLEEAKEEEGPARSARKPRSSSRRSSAAAPKAAPAEELDEEEGSAADGDAEEDGGEARKPRARRAAAPATATKQRASRGRVSKAAVAAEEAAEPEPEAEAESAEDEEPAPAPRPARTPRKSAKASAADVPAQPTRQSSRLRAKTTAA